jgi:hypothetical protein
MKQAVAVVLVIALVWITFVTLMTSLMADFLTPVLSSYLSASAIYGASLGLVLALKVVAVVGAMIILGRSTDSGVGPAGDAPLLSLACIASAHAPGQVLDQEGVLFIAQSEAVLCAGLGSVTAFAVVGENARGMLAVPMPVSRNVHVN